MKWRWRFTPDGVLAERCGAGFAGDVEVGVLNMMRMPFSGVACGASEDAKERKELLLLGLDVGEQQEEVLLQGRDLPEGRQQKQ